MKFSMIALVVLSSTSICMSAQAAKPIAPTAPWSPRADSIVKQWSNLFKKHFTKESALKTTCKFPTASEVGVKAYPGSLLIDVAKGGGSAADSDDVPMVMLVTKAPLKQVIAWYKSHYPGLKAKWIFETAGPGINYLTSNDAQSRHHPSGVAVIDQGGLFEGCGGLLQVPAAYQTGIRIYYQSKSH